MIRPYIVFIIAILAMFNVMAVNGTTTLTIVTEDLPPFQITENNQLVGGTSYLIVKEALEQTPFKTEYHVLPWARAFDIASKEKNVVIFSIVRSPKRETAFKWINKIENLEYHFFAKKGRDDIQINAIEDAKKLRVVTSRNSFEQQLLLKHGFILKENLIVTRGYIEAWEMVNRGRADLILASQALDNGKSIEQNAEQQLFIKYPLIIDNMPLYIAANKDTSDEVVEQIKQALEKVQKIRHNEQDE